MIQRPTDQNHQPCLLLYLEGVTMEPAGRPQILKQQVSDMQTDSQHAQPPPPPPFTTLRHIPFCLQQGMIWSTSRIQCCSSRRSSNSWETSSHQNRVSSPLLFGAEKSRCFIDSSLLHCPQERDAAEGKYELQVVGRDGEIKWQGVE